MINNHEIFLDHLEVQAQVLCGGCKCIVLEIEMLRDLSASEVAVGALKESESHLALASLYKSFVKMVLLFETVKEYKEVGRK